jgi:hypothetical protein
MIIFLHIPKTAGTSLFNWFHETTEHKVGWYGPKNTPDIFFGNPKCRENYLVYGGHFDYHQIKPFLTAEDTVFSVVREPIARAASYYNHVAVRDKNHPLHKNIVGKSIVEAANRCPEFRSELTNHQCWYLSCTRSFAQAKSTIEEYMPTIFTVNQLDLLTKKIGDILGIINNPELKHSNAAETDYFKELSKEDLDYLGKINQDDVKLFEWALNDLDYLHR